LSLAAAVWSAAASPASRTKNAACARRNVVCLPGRLEQFARVLADRLEHPEPPALGADEALVDQRPDRVEITVADVLHRFERATSDEDPQLGAGCDDPHVAPRPRITVVGSINLDLVVNLERLPSAGETVGGGTFSRVPGGKGANQAVACARLGADVTMIGAVGDDAIAEEALAGLRHAGVTLELRIVEAPTGVALIQVDAKGETTIAVAPGANAALGAVELPPHDAVLCQLEVSDTAVLSAWEGCTGLFCLNAAPARPIAIDPDVAVVNRFELETLHRRDGLVALTLGVDGAVLLDDGEEIARAVPPSVVAVDGTAAGDAFTACLLVSLLEGLPEAEALTRACAAGALAASRPGAQPSLPTAAEVDGLLAEQSSHGKSPSR
jgi:ribokinase